MATRDTIEAYFNSLRQKRDWESFLSDDMMFTSFTSPIKRVSGKTAYRASTERFYSMITALRVKEVMVDGDRACALTHYDLQPPGLRQRCRRGVWSTKRQDHVVGHLL